MDGGTWRISNFFSVDINHMPQSSKICKKGEIWRNQNILCNTIQMERKQKGYKDI